MNKKLLASIGITALFIFLFIWLNSQKEVCFEEACFKVVVADTPSVRERGLMFRDSLPQDEGMFFIFEETRIYPFWMKNTLIPLDIIWIDENFKVVHIQTAPPCESDPCPTYDPKVGAKYALEINAGVAEKNGIMIGSKLEFN